MSKSATLLKRIDWITFLLCLALSVIGITAINSTSHTEHFNIFNFSSKEGKQFLWLIISIIVIILIFLNNSTIWELLSPHFYVFMLGLMLITVFVGKEVNGSKSWLGMGGFGIQTAEFMKLATALLTAKYLSVNTVSFKYFRNYLPLLLLLALPIGSTILQHDLGSSIIFLSFLIVLYRVGFPTIIVFILLFFILLFFGVILFENYYVIIILSSIAILLFGYKVKNWKLTLVLLLYVLGGFYIGLKLFEHFHINFDTDIFSTFPIISLFPFGIIYAFRKKAFKLYRTLYLLLITSFVISISMDFIYENVLKPHHRNRIEIYLGLKEDIQRAGFNLHQSKIAIASGGFLGKGYQQGTQTQFGFVPEQSTDFIVTAIAEEFGFVGIVILLTLYLLLFLRLIIISERQTNLFAKYLGYCCLGIIFFHTILNISMTIGLFPTIGIPLPFISYGGSSLLVFSIMIGILLKLDTERKVNF